MNYKELSNQLIELVGGKDNIISVVNCMTRLRFKLKDRNLAETKKIKDMEEVLDVISNDIAYQVVIGTQAADICKQMNSALGLEGSADNAPEQSWFVRIINTLSEAMGPILIPIMASALLTGILSILSMVGVLSADSSTYQIFDAIKNSVFYFLPILLAMSFAKKLDVNEYLAVTVAITLMYESINGAEGLNLFGLNLSAITYSNSFFPIILAVVFMKYVDSFLKKHMPQSLQYFFNPVIILVLTLSVTLLVFGPLGTWIGDLLNLIFTVMMDKIGNWSVIMAYAALQPFLIMMGAGNFIIPIFMNFYATLGYDPVFTPAWVISDIGVCGTVCGYFLKTKNRRQKQLFGTAAFSALMGVTEPAVYGVFVKYRRPFLAVIIGGGLGGLYAGLTKVVGYAPVSLSGIATFIGENNYPNFYNMVIAVVIGFLGSLIAAFLLGIPEEKDQEPGNTEEKKKEALVRSEIASPVSGQVVQLSDVNDKAFSGGALGKGVAFVPEEGTIVSPVDGEIVTLFPTKHAIGLKTEHDIEVLIHIGVDTVELEGKFFESFVKQGDSLKKGDKLIQVDFEKVREAGYDPTVIVVVTNSADYLDIVPTNKAKTEKGDACLTVVV